MKIFFRFLFYFWIHIWNYSLFQLIFFTFIQQFFNQIELQQNLQLNESFDQLADFFWTADEISNVHSICVWVCYLMFYFSKTETVFYYMHCDFFHSVTLTNREFYFRYSHLVQEYCKINSVCSYLNNHHIFCLVKSNMLLDSCIFWFSDSQQLSFRFFCLLLLFSFVKQHFECWKTFLMLIF